MTDTETQYRKKNSKKSPAAKRIMGVTWIVTFVFMAMIGYITYYALTHEQELMNNSYNARQQILLSQNRRGSIYSRNNEVLAQTIINEGGEEVREYPYGNLFSHVIGYSVNGKMGVESQANYYLIHSNAPLSQKASLDAVGEKYPGDNVFTTLDVNLQQVASTALGVYKGAIIVSDPTTGQILAMVSKPDFNPADIEKIWEDLIHDEKNTSLLNRTTQGLYPPGSTFKIVSALEYMNQNPESYKNYQYQCNGTIKRGEDKIQCYHGSVHNQIGFDRSFAKSCNTSFANIGLSLDKDVFNDTLDRLLFNQELPITFPYAKSYIHVEEGISDADMMQASIGQGDTLITPIHLNMITCSIANQGVLMKPYVIDRVENSAGMNIKTYAPSAYGALMPAESATALKELMAKVVTEGTASRLNGLAYTAAGKTGSAEFGTVKGDSHAWFTGFAPVENPEICVTIIIEGAGAGGDYAVPIAKRIFDAYFGEDYS